MEALTVKKKSKKKRIITLVVIVLVIAGIFAACSAMTAKAKKSLAAMTAMETGQVEVRDLISSVGATGKVISLQSKDLTADLAGVEISAIHVEVGDLVEAGQELAVFDTEDIADDLTMAQRALYQSQQRNEISATDAQRGVDDALRNSDYQIDNAAQSVDTAYENYLNGQQDLDTLCRDRSEAQFDWMAARDEYESKFWRQSEVDQNLPRLKEELEQLTLMEAPSPEQVERMGQLPSEIAALEQEKAELAASVPQAEAAMNQAEAVYKQADTAVKNMERSVNTMYNSYTSAVKSYDNMVAAQASSVAAAQSGQQSVAVSANTDQQQKQVNLYADQLAEGVLTAPFGGIITAVNYDPGDTYAQGPILTLQDCSGFEISAQIGQYDISDIALGQKVLIKTDATREQELEGTVVFISPTATVTAGVQTTDPTYEVKISVDTETERLRLDMSANLSIIIAQHENCLTVPYNAVQTAEDGSRFVEVVHEDETTTVVPVEVLLESNYYTEVSGDLTAGQQVRVVSEGSSMLEMFEAMGMEMGGF